MSMTRKTIVLLLAAASAMLVVAAARTEGQAPAGAAKAPPGPPRVAVCNVVKVIQNYRRINDLNTLLQKKQQALQTEEEKKVKAIDDLQAELSHLAEGTKDYEKRMDELLTLKGELKTWKEVQDALLRKWHYQLTKEMFEEVLKAVSDVAQDQGFQLVLCKEPAELGAPSTPELVESMIRQRKVLYGDASLEITEPVITRVNLNYNPTSGPSQ